MKKVLLFCEDIYAPGVHLYFALNWYFALYGAFALNHGKKWVWTMSPLITVTTLFLILFFLRIVDEIKDFEYDKIYNPDRPLVKGTVTRKDLNIYMIVLVLLTLAINHNYGWGIICFLMFEFFYGYLLIHLEKFFKTVRDHMTVNLVFTYPVNILLSVYIFLVFGKEQHINWNQYDFIILISFACNFLYYEFARKICWPDLARQGQKYYSEHFGFIPSIILAVGFGLVSMSLLMVAFETWISLLLVLPLVYGVGKTMVERKKVESKRRLPLSVSGILFLGLYYLIVIAICILDFYAGLDFNRAIGS